VSIFDRHYSNFEGSLTPGWSRFLILARYAARDAFSSRMFLLFFLLCFFWPLACAVIIYLRYNTEALRIFDISVADLLTINALSFRNYYMDVQSTLAIAVALVLGPALISPDLRNNALPLFLSRPLSRLDYVLGKFTVLAAVLSAITWVPGWILFLLQASIAQEGWAGRNFRALVGMFVGFWAWIVVLSLLSLAVSALVKWKPLARILFLGLFVVLAGMGQSFNLIYGTWRGSLLDLDALRQASWDHLFGLPTENGIPGWFAWLGLTAVCGLCAWVLSRRIRAYEVVG